MSTLGQDAVGQHGACQDDWELDQLLGVLSQRPAPRLIVEIGCDRGGTLWLWRQLGADVIAITLHTRPDRLFHGHGAWVVTGDSTDPVTREAAVRLIGSRPVDMVYVDGGHDLVTASADIDWALCLAPRGLVVVHDICPRPGHPEIETYIPWGQYSRLRPYLEIIRDVQSTPGTGVLFPAAA